MIEVKRGKVDLEIWSQVLGYASYVFWDWDYEDLNTCFQKKYKKKMELVDYHKQYFGKEISEDDFNNSIRVVIVGEEIPEKVRKVAEFLREWDIDIYCIEFKYFETEDGRKAISREIVVGEEHPGVISKPRRIKTNEEEFLNRLDENGRKVFEKILGFAKENNLVCKWGKRGFSLNVKLDEKDVSLLEGYPPPSAFKQSIYTKFEKILKNVNNGEKIVEFYKTALENLRYFKPTGEKDNLKWEIKGYDAEEPENKVNKFLEIIKEVVSKIKEHGLKKSEESSAA